jgi:hypothetical protein
MLPAAAVIAPNIIMPLETTRFWRPSGASLLHDRSTKYCAQAEASQQKSVTNRTATDCVRE